MLYDSAYQFINRMAIYLTRGNKMIKFKIDFAKDDVYKDKDMHYSFLIVSIYDSENPNEKIFKQLDPLSDNEHPHMLSKHIESCINELLENWNNKKQHEV